MFLSVILAPAPWFCSGHESTVITRGEQGEVVYIPFTRISTFLPVILAPIRFVGI